MRDMKLLLSQYVIHGTETHWSQKKKSSTCCCFDVLRIISMLSL